MGKTMIITDSGCDIPKNMLNDNIKVINYTICIGEDDYLEEGKINKKVFSQHMNAGLRISEINLKVDNILNILNNLDEDCDEIVFIISSGMMYPNNEVVIRDAVLEYSFKHITTRIAVIDSNTTSMALGFLVLDASKMAEMGCGFDEIVRYVNANKSRYRMDLVANDVTILKEQRIINSRQAKLVESNKKNYLISMSRFGILRPIMKRSTDTEIKEIMIDRLIDDYSDYYAVVSSALNREAGNLVECIGESLDINPIDSIFGCSSTSFVGTDSISLCYKKKK